MAVNEADDNHLDGATDPMPNVSIVIGGEDEDEDGHLTMSQQLARLQVGDGKSSNWTSDKKYRSIYYSSHSRQSELGSELGSEASHTPTLPRNMNMSFNASMDFNDSCVSFASFGGEDSFGDSKEKLGDSGELSEQRAAFLKLESETPKSSRRIDRASHRFGASMSTLQLIEESEE
jgi:hypothetical protein